MRRNKVAVEALGSAALVLNMASVVVFAVSLTVLVAGDGLFAAELVAAAAVGFVASLAFFVLDGSRFEHGVLPLRTDQPAPQSSLRPTRGDGRPVPYARRDVGVE
jgi:hypothetical protein